MCFRTVSSRTGEQREGTNASPMRSEINLVPTAGLEPA